MSTTETCKRFRHDEGGLDTVELPTKSPVVTALHELAFPGGGLIPSARPVGCPRSWVADLTSWVADLTWCARQRRCLEAPPISAGYEHSLYVDSAGRILS
jgi:hypothetical protein